MGLGFGLGPVTQPPTWLGLGLGLGSASASGSGSGLESRLGSELWLGFGAGAGVGLGGVGVKGSPHEAHLIVERGTNHAQLAVGAVGDKRIVVHLGEGQG